MDTLLLEDWNLIYIVGIIFAIGSLIVSLKISRKILFSISIVLSLFCIGLFIYSLLEIRRWEWLIIGVSTISICLGIWIGAIFGIIIRKFIYTKRDN
ncbi:sodium:dicarboxylate symporter [Senegalia massiliensis]|uniref:sodium:dicarboxylate symporter n=1 Tax=Senegalia massiliensis TaxID=1720316 RepID=UPI001030F065|nr:sodium:dicarboxylate symporter [Senegalia massiliensis]